MATAPGPEHEKPVVGELRDFQLLRGDHTVPPTTWRTKFHLDATGNLLLFLPRPLRHLAYSFPPEERSFLLIRDRICLARRMTDLSGARLLRGSLGSCLWRSQRACTHFHHIMDRVLSSLSI